VRKFAQLLYLAVSCGTGVSCGDNYSASKVDKQKATMKSEHAIRTITLSGFDPKGEPSIRILADGRLRVVFEFMPP
jgi:hypothetical protein